MGYAEFSVERSTFDNWKRLLCYNVTTGPSFGSEWEISLVTLAEMLKTIHIRVAYKRDTYLFNGKRF